KHTILHIFFLRTRTFFMLSVNNKDYYFYSLSIQEVLTTRPCGYPAGCSRYVVSISVTISVTVSVTAALLLLTSMKYPVRSLQESKLARGSRIWYNGGMDNNRVLNANVAERIGLTISGVSRIRNANRHPHPLTMRNIYQQYGWDIYDQFERAHYGKRDDYAKKFE